MFDQATDESLHRADENAVQHDRTVRGVVGSSVLEGESFGKIEVQLHCRSLPFATDRVDQLEVELGAVERPSAFVVRE